MTTQARTGSLFRTLNRLLPRIRATEYDDFHRWFREKNARRTRLVGFVFLPFAVFGSTAAALGMIPGNYLVYAAFLFVIALGISIASAALRDRRAELLAVGELLILSTAVVWMLYAVGGRLDVGFGLAEFVVGTLGLALLRGMRPRVSAFLFPALAIAYAIMLAVAGSFDIQAAVNGLVFCMFAFIWSVSAFNGQIAIFRNSQLLTELNRQNAQLASIAVQDPLTGLPNRRYFDQALEHRWSDESRRAEPVVLLLLDIDHFKVYNDTHGHPRGDACLQRVGRILTAGLGTAGLCIRIGGEEFATILSSGTLEGGVAVANRLIERVRREGEITMCAGVASLLPDEGSPHELYAAADRALYRAKELGRDRVEIAR